MKKIKVLSLFSGCGGMDLGFEGGFNVFKESINTYKHNDWIKNTTLNTYNLKETIFETVFANDIKPSAKKTWEKYFSKRRNIKNIYHLESIVNLVKKHEQNIFKFPDGIEMVIGGFPCQDFSVAGKRLGLKSNKSHQGTLISGNTPTIESRGQLYIWMKAVIESVRPKIFIAENVKGLASLEDVKDTIQQDFGMANNNGYLVVSPKILHAANYGVPQSRERIFFIGFLKEALDPNAIKALMNKNISEEYSPYPTITHTLAKNDNSGLPTAVTSSTALQNLSEPDNSKDLSQQKYSKAKFLNSSNQGQSEIKMDEIAPTIRSEHHGNIEYRRLSTEHCGKNITELEQGMIERRLTVRECARIQTFPDDYEFIIEEDRRNSVSASEAYKLIGNAVPPLLAYNIAKNIESKWELYFGKK